MARPEKINYQIIEAICEDISQGYTYDQAALRNGISASTFHRWMQRGQEQESEQIYKDFFAKVKEASNYSELEALQQIRSAAVINRNWKAASWYLERRFPEKYGKRFPGNELGDDSCGDK